MISSLSVSILTKEYIADNMLKKLIAISWVIGATTLFLYSFTQVDLGLTLTRTSVWQGIQQSFQYVGYFNRSLSAIFFCSIILFLFGLFLLTLKAASNGSLSRKQIWAIVISVGVILSMSYAAFSYDIFNYIFDAKIITIYHKDPYHFRALDFPGDPMLSFMHWTHRTYPYGPIWLVITVPLSYVGMNYFLPTYYLFKLLALGSFLGTAYFLEKILLKFDKKNAGLGLVFFALNPLILVEFLVSGHNDMAMMFFAVLSLYLLLTKRYALSIILLALSIGTKYASVFLLLPYAVYFFYKFMKKSLPESRFFEIIVVTMIFPVIIASVRTNFQPWYLLYVLPFAALLPRKYYIVIPVLIVSFFSIFQYLPFLYSGNWDAPIPMILLSLIVVSVIVSIVGIVGYGIRYNRVKG